MKTTIWDALLSPVSNHSQTPCIAGLLCGEEESDGDRVRFGAPGDSPSVMLTRHGADYLSADVFLPAAGTGLTGEQERALRELNWSKVSYSSPEKGLWEAQWRWYADAEVRAQRGRSMVTVLSDVLRLPADDLVVRSWGYDGPIDPGYGLGVFDDRPSQRGVTGPPTGWDDLTDRLDWALCTLPAEGCVGLGRPGFSMVQIMKSYDGTAGTNASDPSLDPANLPSRSDPRSEHARQLFESGWSPELVAPDVACWTLGEPRVFAGAGSLARQVVAAVRALGAGQPTDVRASVFRNGRAADPDYVVTELGLEAG
ncbi:hypothetical protein ACFFTU_24820 [Streptomyces cremeus]|uniref:TY-Chap N-terminal domain-containing protein n=1 Tax=Streptomyces cremeus TaxID=66881 RepID=A0ABV5PJB8_STRCM